MANVTIPSVEGGEKHLPLGTDNMELDDGTSVFARLNNLAKALLLMEEGSVWNYVITPSVASNNLTVALKTIAGADPSTDDAIIARLGGARKILTAALTFTLNAATGWFGSGAAELATLAVDYFVYLIAETGGSAGTKLGISRLPYARTMADFVNTNNSEKYIGGSWTNFNATDVVMNIGRFTAILSAGAGFTWTLPAPGVINRPIYNTELLTWVPVQTGWGGSPPTGGVYHYKIMGDGTVWYEVNQPNSATSTAGTCKLTLPFTAAIITNKQWQVLGQVMDAGVMIGGLGTVVSAATELAFFKDYAGSTFTSSGNKRINSAAGYYRIGP